MIVELIPLIALGFGLGLMHALDADHVMAVTSLSNQKPSIFKTVRFCVNWAVGHATILIISGLCLFGLGIALPESVQKIAEAGVGVFLIVIGVVCFIQFKKDRISLVVHRHSDVEHCHWQTEDHIEKESNKQQKAKHLPVMVGGLHGLAGSAPIFALVPVINQENWIVALSYLMIFSLGVMLSMLLFGLGFGFFQHFLKQRYQFLFQWSRRIIAATSILLGSIWLFRTV